jgi:uncharacterized protein (DUF1501 family)
MDFNVDFRTVYRSILEKWMGVPASAMPAIFPSPPVDKRRVLDIINPI